MRARRGVLLGRGIFIDRALDHDQYGRVCGEGTRPSATDRNAKNIMGKVYGQKANLPKKVNDFNSV
jgi:hypothetical protein